jgi:hypothetical protein
MNITVIASRDIRFFGQYVIKGKNASEIANTWRLELQKRVMDLCTDVFVFVRPSSDPDLDQDHNSFNYNLIINGIEAWDIEAAYWLKQALGDPRPINIIEDEVKVKANNLSNALGEIDNDILKELE